MREILLSATVMCNIQCHDKSNLTDISAHTQNLSVIDLKELNFLC